MADELAVRVDDGVRIYRCFHCGTESRWQPGWKVVVLASANFRDVVCEKGQCRAYLPRPPARKGRKPRKSVHQG